MDTFVMIVQHPVTALGIAGFVVLQVFQLSRWAERQADMVWWRSPVEEAATVYVRATGKDLARLEAMDVDQIAAAAGCRTDIADMCLRDLVRRHRHLMAR